MNYLIRMIISVFKIIIDLISYTIAFVLTLLYVALKFSLVAFVGISIGLFRITKGGKS